MDKTLPSLATIIENLLRAQSNLLRAADAVPRDQWCKNPRNPCPFWKRFHVPMMFVEARVIRRKAPVTLETQWSAKRRRFWQNCAECGSGRLAFIEETRGRDLSK